MDFHKYKHNFDYHLAILIMGNKYYMNNDSIILTENIAVFSPVSQVHYEKYADAAKVSESFGRMKKFSVSWVMDIQLLALHRVLPCLIMQMGWIPCSF